MEQSFSERGIKMYFVLQEGQDVTNVTHDFKEAFEKCKEKNIKLQWITEKECRELKLTNKIVVAVQNFNDVSPNSLLSYLRKQPCMVLGPRCILFCLMRGIPTPDGPAPVCNMTMMGLVVCFSGFKSPQKENLKFKVESMGGTHMTALTNAVTHLVACRVLGARTAKYNTAAEMKLPIMSEQWIHECWDLSQKQTVNALDPPLSSLVFPPFLNLRICSSQINRAKKDNLKRIIEAKGGIYTAALAEEETDVLVTGAGCGDKFVHARKWGIPCVNEEWVKQSAETGYALKFSQFEVKPDRASTPEKNKPIADPNFSMVSCISGEGRNNNVINETIATESSFLEPCPPRSRFSQLGMRKPRQTFSMLPKPMINETLEPEITTQDITQNEHRTPEKAISKRVNTSSKQNLHMSNSRALNEIENLQMADLKRAGPFLDGCKVYLSGFTPSSMDSVRKVLNRAGATRLDQISDEVSHVILAGTELTTEEQRALKMCEITPQVVQVAWLLKSMKLGHPANIELFSCFEMQKTLEPSPLSKKGLQMWQQSAQESESSKAAQAAVAQSDMDLVKQYIQFDGGVTQMDTAISPVKATEEELAKPLDDVETNQENENVPEEPEGDVEKADDEEEEESKIFTGLKFWAVSVPKEDQTRYSALVEKCGGSWQKPADYVIVPQRGTKAKCPGKETVTHVWLEDCVDQEAVLPAQYYHKPWDCPKHDKPLTGLVMAISNYVGKERTYLAALASELGAKFQEVFAKKKAPGRNAEASTHLLCPTPVGDKYKAAVKWKLPVITKDWLLACAQDGRHIEEEPFLLEGSVPVAKTDVPSAKLAVDSSMNTTASSANSIVANSRDSIGFLTLKQQVDSPQVKQVPQDISTPLSAVPSRLRMPAKTPVQEKSFSAAQEMSSTDILKTPDNANHSVQFATPTDVRTPSQQYTPFIPEQLKQGYVATHVKPAGTPDVGEMTPRSFEKYWDTKVPGYMPTPDTPYGAGIQTDEVSPMTKKVWKKYADSIPTAFKASNKGPIHTYTASELAKIGRKRSLDGDDETENLENKRSRANIEEENLVKKSIDMDISNISKDDTEESKLEDSRITNSATNSRLSTGSSSSSRRDSKGFTDDDSSISDSAFGTQNKHKFMITGIGEPEREQITLLIKELKGQCSDMNLFDPTSTHLITAQIARSEKLLASIASGKWIVHHKYLIDSNKKRQFLQEDAYEWGNPKAVYVPALKPGSMADDLAKACYRWRIKLQSQKDPSHGAFTGIKAIVHGNENRVQAISRLIIAGGGEVLDISAPFSDPKNATHCFSDLKSEIDLAALNRNKVPILNYIYLNDFLLRDPSPTPQQWIQENHNKS